MTTIVFHSEVPHDKYVVRAVCRALGAEVTGDLARAERLVVAFCDTTVREERREHAALPPAVRVVNRRATDIRKSRVEAAFVAAFGYGSFVDPRAHAGACVAKSEINARRDGRIVRCPVDAVEPGAIYQVVVDNHDGDGRFRDLRVPVFDGRVPFVYVCGSDEAARFSGPNAWCRIAETRDVLQDDELRRLAAFTAHLGFDYGELNVVRDARDGRLFVLDANHTPYGPPGKLVDDEKARAIDLLAAAFVAAFRP